MKPDKLLLELEQLLEQCGYRLRKERGSFRGNDCIVQGDKLVIVNKNRPVESQVGTIARILAETDLNDIYVKPAVKKQLSEMWERLSLSPHHSNEELNFEE